jgi:hypothetical protein
LIDQRGGMQSMILQKFLHQDMLTRATILGHGDPFGLRPVSGGNSSQIPDRRAQGQ